MKLKGLLKGFFILGLSILPISFSSAVNFVENVGDYEDLGSNNNCTIKSDLSFDCSESNNVIVGTDMGWFKSSSSYFRTNSGLVMYIHFQNGIDYQGYITSFTICDSSNYPSCNSQMSYQDFLTYASNYELTKWEWYSSQSTPGWAGIVFIFGDTYISYVPHTTSNGQIIGQYGSYIPYNFGLNGWGLDANYSIATNSPFYDSSLHNVEIVDGIPCYTVGQLFQTDSKYNTGLCYSSSKIISGGVYTPITPKSILELFPTYNDFRDSINSYYNYCTTPASSDACQSVFGSYPEQWSLISKIPSDVRTNNLYDLCSMYLNYGLDTNVCTLTGSQITPSYFTTEGYAEYLRQQGVSTVVPASGSVFNTLDGGDSDIVSSIFGLKQFFVNITSFFTAYNSNNGILPTYIGFFLVAFALFYLFKKS